MKVRLTNAQKIRILNSDDMFGVMQRVLLREQKIDQNKEHLWIVCLSANHSILLIELISLGSVKQTVADPMEVFSFALQKRAVKIILVHNHPSGDVSPSLADMELTDRMLAIGKFLNVPVLDHLIISEVDYYSFSSTGMLSKIERESSYDLTFRQVDVLKSKMLKAQKSKVMEMATRMLSKKYSLREISEITGLSESEVKYLKKPVRPTATTKGKKRK